MLPQDSLDKSTVRKAMAEKERKLKQEFEEQSKKLMDIEKRLSKTK